jgi:O-antigen ligase
MALLFSGGLLISVLVLVSAFRVSDVNSLAVSFAMPFFQDRGSGAGFLTFSVLAAFALLQGVSARRLKWAIGLGALFIATAILVSGTRSAYVGLAIVVLVAPLVGTRFASYTVAATLAFLLLLGTVKVDSQLLDSLTGRMERSIHYYDEQREGSITERFDLWDAAWRISIDKPLFGIGYDQFGRRSREWASVPMGVNAHNEYLKLAAETGWPCTLLWIGLIGSALLTAKSIAASRVQAVRALFGAAWLCVICYSVQGLFNNFQQISKIAFTYSFLIALLLGLRAGLFRPRRSA